MFPQWMPNKATRDAAAAEAKRFVEIELPRRLEHTEQVREAREARQATGDMVRWHVAWGQAIGILIAVAALGGFVVLAILLLR